MVELSDREQSNQSPQDKGKQTTHMEYREGTANITDYSPEWAYPEVRKILFCFRYSGSIPLV